MVNHVRGGPGNSTGTDTAISTTDTEVDSLIRTLRVRKVNHVRGVPVTVLVRIPGPECTFKIILLF